MLATQLTILGSLLVGASAGGGTDLSWFTLDGGGGTSVGVTFSLSGTVGQADASPALAGGDFTFVGGFWAVSGGGALPCPPDFDGDGIVGGPDLAHLLGAWGFAGGDLDGDAITGPSDLAILLGSWGPC